MVGEPIDFQLVDALEDGDVLVEGDKLYEFRRLPNTTEKVFEDDVAELLREAGWHTFANNAEAQADYDRKLALKVDSLIGFVRETQPEEWAKIEGLYGSHTRERFLKRLCDELEPHGERGGVVNVLRHGIRMAPGAQFRLCYFRPATEKNPDAWERYRANRFEVVRQLRYGTMPDDAGNSVDVVLFLNGIPVVTMELKNNLTGQRTEHAVKQYKTDRSPMEVLFKANRRAIVHFALDSETVEMCTWLANGKSRFLPFNRGNGKNGAGNPPNPDGYRTEYLYREVLSPDSLLDIVQRFVRVEYNQDTHAMKKIIFPRFHQLDAVRNLVADAKASGAGKSYLIQHSAGSGKSNSIAWLAHHLQSLHDGADNPVFDSVVILTDRRNLDAQLSETIDAVEHKRGVVVRIREEDGSAGLREALNSGAQIITSTIQKFPYICSETKASGRKFAVIIDEAHSSQSGKANAKMKLALIDRDLDPDEPWDTIRASFSDYYEATQLDAATDPDVIYNLAERLDGYRVYETTEVEAVATVYFDEPDPGAVLRKIEPGLQPAVDRWQALDDTPKREFKALLRKFLRSYSFITQMISLGDEDLHRLFVYAGFLVKKLFLDTGSTPDLRDKVELEYLRIEDKGTQAIKLESTELHNGGANAGVSKEEEEERLSVLIDHLNEAFGAEWTEADKIMKACADKICEDEEFVAKARTNSMGDLRAIFGDVMMRALAAILSDSQDMFEKFNENPDAYMRVMNSDLLPIVYRRCNADDE